MAATGVTWGPGNLFAQTASPDQATEGTEPPLQLSEPCTFIPKSQMSPAERKISSNLRSLVSQVASRGPSKAAVLGSGPEALSNAFRRVNAEGMIQCYVMYSRDVEGVAMEVATAGGRVEILSPEMSLLQCQLPYDAVSRLAADDRVRAIRLHPTPCRERET